MDAYLDGLAIQEDDLPGGLLTRLIRLLVSVPDEKKESKRTSPAAIYPPSADTATVVIWPLVLTRSDVTFSTSVDACPSQVYTWTLLSSYLSC